MKRIFSILFALVLAVSLMLVPAALVAASPGSIVGLWHLDEGTGPTASDNSGYGNDGTIYGAGWVSGKYGQALSFDGNDDYVDFGSDASLQLTDEFTIELWVNRTDKTTFERFLSHSIAANTYAYEVGVDYTNPNEWRLRLNSDEATLTVAMAEDAGEWIHVAFVYDKSLASANMKIYENGTLVASGDYNTSLTNHGTLRTNRQGKDDGWLKSLIDEVRIWDGARTDDEIWLSYAALHVDDDGTEWPGAYPTITEALAVASAGDTIIVHEGTYDEQVAINKALTLQGAGAGSTTIQGSSGAAVTISANNVTIDGFRIENPNGTAGIRADGQSYITIKNNIVTNIDGAVSGTGNQGIAIVASDATPITDITIEDNQINGIQHTAEGRSATGIWIGNTSGSSTITNVVIQRNTISNISANTSAWQSRENGGKGAYGILINYGGKTVDAQVLDNTISDLEGLWAHGIGLEGDTPNAVVERNDISNLTDHKTPSDAVAVMVEDNADAATVGIHFNNFYNLNVGVENRMSATANATMNWWGNVSGPSGGVTDPQTGTSADGTGDSVSANVLFDPWLGMNVSDLRAAIVALHVDKFYKEATDRRVSLLVKVDAVLGQIENGEYRSALNKLKRDLTKRIKKWIEEPPRDKLIALVNAEIDILLGFLP